MDKSESIFVLIKSMSKSEKRYFKLNSGFRQGEKLYLSLFDFFCHSESPEKVEPGFRKSYPGANYQVAMKHLYKRVIHILSLLHEDQDIQLVVLQHLRRASLLYERQLYDEAFGELKKGAFCAQQYENQAALLLIKQTEMKYRSVLGFDNISEKELVSKQMEMHEVIRHIRNTNMHISLYDILQYRLSRQNAAETNREDYLNDLLLSELSLIGNRAYKGFESTKQHLLFQATYYLNMANYKAAIRYYRELVHLFDTHKHLMLNPPEYYFRSLVGVLESLRTAGLWHELPYFTERLSALVDEDKYPLTFVAKASAYRLLYRWEVVIKEGEIGQDNPLKQIVSLRLPFISTGILLQLYLQAAIISMCQNNLSVVRQCLKPLFTEGKKLKNSFYFRIARLMRLVIEAEQVSNDFIQNEMTSLKRENNGATKKYRAEKLLFSYLRNCPLPRALHKKKAIWQLLEKEIISVRDDTYERPFLKIFDITLWIESRLTNVSFVELMMRLDLPQENGLKKIK